MALVPEEPPVAKELTSENLVLKDVLKSGKEQWDAHIAAKVALAKFDADFLGQTPTGVPLPGVILGPIVGANLTPELKQQRGMLQMQVSGTKNSLNKKIEAIGAPIVAEQMKEDIGKQLAALIKNGTVDGGDSAAVVAARQKLIDKAVNDITDAADRATWEGTFEALRKDHGQTIEALRDTFKDDIREAYDALKVRRDMWEKYYKKGKGRGDFDKAYEADTSEAKAVKSAELKALRVLDAIEAKAAKTVGNSQAKLVRFLMGEKFVGLEESDLLEPKTGLPLPHIQEWRKRGSLPEAPAPREKTGGFDEDMERELALVRAPIPPAPKPKPTAYELAMSDLQQDREVELKAYIDAEVKLQELYIELGINRHALDKGHGALAKDKVNLDKLIAVEEKLKEATERLNAAVHDKGGYVVHKYFADKIKSGLDRIIEHRSLLDTEEARKENMPTLVSQELEGLARHLAVWGDVEAEVKVVKKYDKAIEFIFKDEGLKKEFEDVLKALEPRKKRIRVRDFKAIIGKERSDSSDTQTEIAIKRAEEQAEKLLDKMVAAVKDQKLGPNGETLGANHAKMVRRLLTRKLGLPEEDNTSKGSDSFHEREKQRRQQEQSQRTIGQSEPVDPALRHAGALFSNPDYEPVALKREGVHVPEALAGIVKSGLKQV